MPESFERLYGWNADASGPLASGPLIGEVSQDSARIWVQARSEAPLTLRVYAAGAETPARTVEQTPSAESFLCAVFAVTGLAAEKNYEYSFLSEHGETARWPLRLGFSTDAKQLRIAFGSCYKEYSSPLPIFESIAQAAPDLLLLLGDTCYTDDDDRQSEATHMQAHLRNRNNSSLRKLIARVPTLGIWDDHDYGPNDSDGTYSEKARSWRCFSRMWAQKSFGLPETPGIFSKVAFGPVDLFLLDSRWYRRERSEILGQAQLGWLKQELSRSEAKVKLLLSGSQLLPEVAALGAWNWECFRRDGAHELKELETFIAENDIRGVVALSGDPHLGQFLHTPGKPLADGKRGPELWELTSSPLANRPWPKPVWPADSHGDYAFDRYLVEEAAVPNFGLLDIDLVRADAEVRLFLCGEDGKALFSHDIALSSLRVRPARKHLCAAVRDDKRAYCFIGDKYARYDLQNNALAEGSPRAISDGWKGVFADRIEAGFEIDAVMFNTKGKAYFFLGNGYVRFDLESDHADPGYPKYIAPHWRGVFGHRLDAILPAGDDKVYFLQGDLCVRYDLHEDRAEPGYPRRIAEEFPGVWDDGIDGAVGWTDGAYYFLRGDEVLRYDSAQRQPAAGYPRKFSSEWFGFLK